LNYLHAQEKFIPGKHIFSMEVGSGINFFVGNNFIVKTYKSNMPFILDMRFRLYDNFGIGGGLEINSAHLKAIQYVGNSTGGVMINWFGYAFYNIPIGKSRWLFVPKAGISSYELTNTFTADDYYGSYPYHTYGTSYFLSPEIDYFITSRFAVFGNLQYGFIHLDSRANENATGTSYRHTNQIGINLGIRF
jgi:hypothetical protein